MKRIKFNKVAFVLAMSGMASFGAHAFDTVNWQWNANVNTNVTQTVTADVEVYPTGALLIKSGKQQIYPI